MNGKGNYRLNYTIFAIFCLFLSLFWVVSAKSATFTVNSTADTVDANPGDGICADAGGNCTLRAAIQEANALSGTDTINVPAGTYTLTISGTGEDAAATGDLDINESLTITGAGMATTIVDGGGIDRVFHITGSYTVIFSGITIQNGFLDDHGGGIYNYGTLTLNNCTIKNNTITNSKAGGGIFTNGPLTLNQSTVSNNECADLGSGGGIYNGNNLILNNSVITGNRAWAGGGLYGFAFTAIQSTIKNNTADSYFGGGIYVTYGNTNIQQSLIANNKAPVAGGIYIYPYTTVSITQSTISGNMATNEGLGTFSSNQGGGIFNSGSLTITASTISANSAGLTTSSGDIGTGGGIYNNNAFPGNTGSITLTNSTISGNSSLNYGGGIYVESGTVTMSNVTITNNTADTRNTGSGNGGGVDNGSLSGPGGQINLKNTIIAGNIDRSGEAPDCSGSLGLTSQGYNLLGNDTGCTFTASTGDQVGTGNSPIDPLFGPLGNNRGPTRTHSLASGSPALDAGNPAGPGSGGNACEAADQRGISRPIDGNNDSTATCDIGAVEVSFANPVDLSLTKVANRNSVAVNEPLIYTLTITNNGPNAATGVVLTDTLPLGSVYVSSNSTQGTCNEAAGIITCTIGDMNNGDTTVVTIKVNAPATHGTITNSGEISCSCNDIDLWNNTVSLATLVMIALPRTGQVTCYDQNGTVTSCDNTAQDGEIKAGVDSPSPRFHAGTDLEVDCLTDTLTGLMWAKNGNIANGTKTWQEALNFVASINSGAGLCGHHDWRLPNINELQSLHNFGTGDISAWLESQGFTNTKDKLGACWSSTSVDFSPGYAWRTLAGVPKSNNAKNFSNNVLPVRGDSAPPAQVWKTGQGYCYNASGGYVSCDASGQDGEFQKGAEWPDPRFADLGDGTVMDKLTGLIWLKDANCFGYLSWQGALNKVADFNINYGNYTCQNYTGSYTDWRMPNIVELNSLIDHSMPPAGSPFSANALPTDHLFVNIAPFAGYYPCYWSSTSNASPWFIGEAWALLLRNGQFLSENKISPSFNTYLWPVRAGVVPDTKPPTGSILINNNDPYTNSVNATLGLNATDPSSVTEMCISDTNSCSSWEVFANTKPWTLPGGDGSKTVYAWFKDSLGNTNSTPYSDSIILDATVPADGTLNATPGNGQVTLDWNGFSDVTSGIGSYKLVFSISGIPSSCSSGAGIYSGSNTSYPHAGLSNGTPYYYRVCATDNSGNTTSGVTASATTFPDNDNDGVTDQEERGPDGATPNYDGNSDGIADNQQVNVTSMHTFGGSHYVTLASPNGTSLSNVQANNNPSPGNSPVGVTFPYGFFAFTVEGVTAGGSTTVKIYLPAGANPNTYYKYGPEPGNPTDHWYEFLYDGQTGAQFSGDVITLHFVDGLRGDDDLTANGMIVDQGAPGLRVVDQTGPSLGITSHTNNQDVDTASITLSGTASDSGKGNNGIQQVTVNGIRANNDTATGTGTANWSKAVSLSPGANVLTVVAYDDSSNHNQTSQTITIYYDLINTIYVSTVSGCNGHSHCWNGIQNGIAQACALGPSIIEITQGPYDQGSIFLDCDEEIMLEGGWDTNFESCSSYTTIKGPMTITHGTIIIENIILK